MHVLTQHCDNARTGANLQETELNPATVAPGSFGKLFELTVEGHVYAQPLYVAEGDIPAVKGRNLLYVATMRNNVYAFDADAGGAPVWSRPLGPFVRLPDPNIGPGGYSDIADAVGIVSTPVISLEHQAIYVVAMTHDGGQYSHRLHALDLATGTDKLGGPVAIQGTVSGTGDGNVNGEITFVSHLQNQRPALLLANGTIYVAFASYGDFGAYHGWVFGFDAATLRRRPNIFNPTRLGSAGGIWMAGQGPAADPAGNVYVITGNGTFAQAATSLMDETVLNETAHGHPAMAARDGGQSLVIGWTGTDPQQHLNVMETKTGSSFSGKVTLADKSIDGPALAFGNGRIFLAWTGDDPLHSLNVSSSTDLLTFVNKKVLAERSNHGPALAFGGGRIFLAWTGTDGRLNVNSSADGIDFGSKVTLEETSDSSPGLAYDGGMLYLLWQGADPNHELNVLQSADGINFTGKVTLTETSEFQPALARQSQLHLVWTGSDPQLHLNQLAGAAPTALGSKDTYNDSSRAAPALAVLGGQLFLGWTGADRRASLNIAMVSLAGGPSLGDSFVKLAPDLSLTDWFSPWNTQTLKQNDTDLGSGGAFVPPGANVVVGGGKEGKLYVLDAGNLGHFCSTCGDPAGDTQIVQWFQATAAQNTGHPAPASGGYHHIHGSPVFWHAAKGGARIYVWGEADRLRAFRFNNPKFDPSPVDISDVTTPDRSMPGGMLTISADGDRDGSGIIWASHPVNRNANQGVVAGMVRAIDAGNLKRELWNSTNTAADDLGLLAKFTPPTVANGKVFLATFSGKVCVYGRK